MPTDRLPIGLKIKRARERLRLTQEDLAGHVGVSQKTIDNWEHDRSYPRSAIGALEAILGPLTQTPSDAETPPRGSGFPEDYPEFVEAAGFQRQWREDPAAQEVWRVARPAGWTDAEAQTAIETVWRFRDMMARADRGQELKRA